MKAAEILITTTTCDTVDRLTDFVRHCCERAHSGLALVDAAGQPLRLQLSRTAEGYQIQVAAALLSI